MKKNNLIFLLILAVIFLLITNCNSIEPPDDELKPGRRDYTWEADTLAGLNNPRDRMWGSSPNDVWATTTSNWANSFSHFSGESWFTYGVPGINQPNAIYGFSSSDVFVGDENGKIWRGPNWKLFAEIIKDGHKNIGFNNIWGISSNDLYAIGAYPDTVIGGYNTTLVAAHYSNNNWSILNKKNIIGIGAKIYKDSNDIIYILTYKLGGGLTPDSSIIYEYNQENFKKIYSSIWVGGEQADISLINSEVYFILGSKIAKRVNGQFQTFLQVDNPNFYQRIWGRNSKDIFLLMRDGLAHYNGTDIQYLFYFNKVPRT
ncbi:MAG TPA: hypothetical protein PK665_14335, partial [Ignavibacteriaceae bacterium]|nr:hypothetical protein [Ignavibacteriaceae bacterium]